MRQGRVALFPGQGVPARTVLESLPEDHELLGRADEILGYELRKRVEIAARRKGAVLQTALAQPAIFVASVIGYERAVAGGASFDAIVGHSLGEYPALVAGEAISFEAGVALVKVRGEAMDKAARTAPGGMIAVLGLGEEDVESIRATADLAVANDNAPGQVVLSGPEERLTAAAGLAKNLGGRSVLLQVQGPFHTSAMAPAVKELEDALDQVDVRSPRLPVVSNVSARPYKAPGEIRKLLVTQLVHRVRFRESLEWVWSRGVRDYVDVGPGDVAAGLANRTFTNLERNEEAVGV
jgi:trans-AT polyketide synthase/acyltransferase/oxidoreductase domain-containing protein